MVCPHPRNLPYKKRKKKKKKKKEKRWRKKKKTKKKKKKKNEKKEEEEKEEKEVRPHPYNSPEISFLALFSIEKRVGGSYYIMVQNRPILRI